MEFFGGDEDLRLRGGPERDLVSFGGVKSVGFGGSFRREVYLRVLWTLALPRFVALITATSPRVLVRPL